MQQTKLKIKNIEYHLEPVDKFKQIVIYEENNQFRIGLSFGSKLGTESFFMYKNMIVGAFGYCANNHLIDGMGEKFDSFEEVEKVIETLTVKQFEKDFTKHQVKNSRFLLSKRIQHGE